MASVEVSNRCDLNRCDRRACGTATRVARLRWRAPAARQGGRGLIWRAVAAMRPVPDSCHPAPCRSVIPAGVMPYHSPRPTSRNPSSGVGPSRSPHASATRAAPYTARASGEQKTLKTGTPSGTPACIIAAAARASASPFVESGTSAPPYTAPCSGERQRSDALQYAGLWLRAKRGSAGILWRGIAGAGWVDSIYEERRGAGFKRSGRTGLSPLLTSPCRTHTILFGAAFI